MIIEVLGGGSMALVGRRLGVSGKAVRKWKDQGRLPRTEWTGETNYAEQVERLTDGKLTKAALLVIPAHNPTPAQNGCEHDGSAAPVEDSGTCQGITCG